MVVFKFRNTRLIKAIKFAIITIRKSENNPFRAVLYRVMLFMLRNIFFIFSYSFVQTLNKMIHVDVDKAGYTEKIWQYFIAGTYSQKLTSLVTSQIIQARRHSPSKAHRYIAFWMFLFLKIPRWSRYNDFNLFVFKDYKFTWYLFL